MTNILFGTGNKWNGKSFSSSSSSSSLKGNNKGINRFIIKGKDTPLKKHEFDFSFEESKIQPGTQSILLKYSRYQKLPISLWYTMKDEIRVLPVDCEEEKIFLGMGCMAWSGGMLNAAPFCLWKSQK